MAELLMARKDISDLQVCEAARDCHDQECRDEDGGILFATHVLAHRTGQPLKVCERAMERAEFRGYIDCGVSTRSGWPTDKGRKLLADAGLFPGHSGGRSRRPPMIFPAGTGCKPERPRAILILDSRGFAVR